MKSISSKAARAAITTLSRCAVLGTARAELIYAPPVIEDETVSSPFLLERERAEQAAASALAERRQTMIADCEQNNGTECVREVDVELRAEGLQSGARVIHLRPVR